MSRIAADSSCLDSSIGTSETSTWNSVPSARAAGISMRSVIAPFGSRATDSNRVRFEADSAVGRPRGDALGDRTVRLALDVQHEVAIVRLAHCLRHDDVARVEADDMLAATAEHGLRGGIELENLAARSKDHHTIERGFENRAMPCLAVAQCLLGQLPFELGGDARGDDLQDGFGLSGVRDRRGVEQRNQPQRLAA